MTLSNNEHAKQKHSEHSDRHPHTVKHKGHFLVRQLKKKRWVIAATLGLLALGLFLGREQFSFARRIPAGPAVKADIQFPFDNGQGLAKIGVEDVVLGVGMITGSRLSDGTSKKGFSGDLSFEMAPYKPGIRIQVQRVRLIERTPVGDGRVFEPSRIYDDAMEEGREPGVKFPESVGKFPFVWESGKKAYVYFVFKDLPDDLKEGDLILTYTGDFPGKKHTAYYEERLAFQRKEYAR